MYLELSMFLQRSDLLMKINPFNIYIPVLDKWVIDTEIQPFITPGNYYLLDMFADI